MRNRKQFMVTVAASGAALAMARKALSAAEPAPTASATEKPPPAGGAPSPKPTQKPPSATALAVAATMRRFDARLSDAEIAAIAKDIDENAQAGAALNPKKKRLKNSDQPVTVFTVPLR
jgi:hypothetical protein